jgi:hypothetical protein
LPLPLFSCFIWSRVAEAACFCLRIFLPTWSISEKQ